MLTLAQHAGHPPVAVLTGLAAFSTAHLMPSTFSVWGNGASFNPVLTAELHRRHDRVLPWRYDQVHCHRTLLALYPDVRRHNPETAHDALSDAHALACAAVNILRLMTSTEVLR